MSDKDDPTKFPEPSKLQETLTTLIRVAIASAPNPLALVSPLAPNPLGAAGELFSAVFSPALIKRRTEWLEDWARAVARLQERMELQEAELRHLLEKPEAISAFMQATDLALREHRREKRQMLRNAYLNVVVGSGPRPDLVPAMMGLIGALTECEVQLLTFFHEPYRFGVESIRDLDFPWNKDNGPAKTEALKRVHCLGGESYLYEFFISDLASRGMLELALGGVASPGQEVSMALNPDRATEIREQFRAPRPTAMAAQFLAFVQSPIPDSEDAPQAHGRTHDEGEG